MTPLAATKYVSPCYPAVAQLALFGTRPSSMQRVVVMPLLTRCLVDVPTHLARALPTCAQNGTGIRPYLFADGYGFCHVPTSPGNHKIECVTWRPVGTFAEQARGNSAPLLCVHPLSAHVCPYCAVVALSRCSACVPAIGGDPKHSFNPSHRSLFLLFVCLLWLTRAAYFVGGGPQLNSPELVHSALDRYRLRTQAMGTIMLDISIIAKDFEKYGVEM